MTFQICYRAKLAFIYADDTLLYQTVNNNKDAEVFQSDINAVYEWFLKWKMPFNEKNVRRLTSEVGRPHPITNWVPHVLNGSNTLNTLGDNPVGFKV